MTSSPIPRGGEKPGIQVIEQTDAKTKTEPALPWNVIVHDDPVTLQSYVTMVFQRVFGYAYPKARRLMLEVHLTGRSLVWTGAREEAELYVQKLHSHQLLATMERPV